MLGEGEGVALRTIEYGKGVGLVFDPSRVVAMGTVADVVLGNFAMDVFTAAQPLRRGKKKPSLGVVE